MENSRRILGFPMELLPVAALAFFTFGMFACQQFHTVLLEFEKGFPASSIGTLLMTASLVNIATPFLILYSQRWIREPKFAFLFLLLIGAGALSIFPRMEKGFGLNFSYLFIAMAMYACFPMIVATLRASSRKLGDSWFLTLRSIGTLGFASFSLVASLLARHFDLQTVYLLFVAAALIAFVIALRTPMHMPRQKVPLQIPAMLKSIFTGKTRNILLLITLNHLAAFSAVAYLGNFIRHELEGSNADVSLAWSIGTFAEVPIIWGSVWVLKRFGLKALLISGLGANALRLLLTFLAPSLVPFLFVQLLHGVFYGATMPAWTIYLDRKFGKEKLHGLLLISGIISGGIAMAMAGKVGGLLWESIGLRSLYLVGGILCLLTVLLFTRIKFPK